MPRRLVPNKDGSNLFDRIFKENAEQLFIPLIQDQLGLEIASYELLREKMPRTLEREVDFLYRITGRAGRQWILHLEFQRENEKDLPYRMAEYHGVIFSKYRLPVRHVVVYLGSRNTRFRKRLPRDMVYPGFEVIQLNKLNTDQLLSSQLPEVVLLAILSAYPSEREEAVLRLVITRLKESCRDETDLLKRVAQLTFLSRLRNLKEETLTVIEQMPITFDMEKDKLYLRGVAEGERKGEVKGLERGEQIGLKRGEQIGLEKGEQIGLERGQTMGIELAVAALALLREGRKVKEVARLTSLSEVSVAKLAKQLG